MMVTDLKVGRWTWTTLVGLQSRKLSLAGSRSGSGRGSERVEAWERLAALLLVGRRGSVRRKMGGLWELGEAPSWHPAGTQGLSLMTTKNLMLPTAQISLGTEPPPEPPNRAQAFQHLDFGLVTQIRECAEPPASAQQNREVTSGGVFHQHICGNLLWQSQHRNTLFYILEKQRFSSVHTSRICFGEQFEEA